jgi:hypothetical protein
MSDRESLMLPKNPWSEYKRQKPASAESLATAFLHVCFVVIMIGFTYYALKCKPFQTVSFGAQQTVVQENQHALIPLPIPAQVVGVQNQNLKKKIAARHLRGT